jgi:hypothetical protein
MNEQQRQISIEKNKLQLSFWDKFSHFSLVAFLCSIPLIFLFFHLKVWFNGKTTQFFIGELPFLVIPIILGVVVYKLQCNRLKFKVVQTNLSRQELDDIIEKVGKELKWYPNEINENYFIAKTHQSFFSWGEQITIIFGTNEIFINSICDLDKRSSVVSMGRNKKNVRRLIEEIETADAGAGHLILAQE